MMHILRIDILINELFNLLYFYIEHLKIRYKINSLMFILIIDFSVKILKILWIDWFDHNKKNIIISYNIYILYIH